MNKKLSSKKQLSHKVMIFWSMIGLLTLIFIVTVIVMFVKARSSRSIDDLINLHENEIFEQKESYYIYVYSKVGITDEKAELDKAADLEELIITYMTYAKRNSQAKRIYGMNVDSYRNRSVLITGSQLTEVLYKTKFINLRINTDDVPILMKIEGGKVVKDYLTEKAIREELDSQMKPIIKD
ncbi:MAG: hypothetical protein M0R05_05825 [Bacilli bacterium]|nr:hypothetical protein [Bacilli bacterium]